MSHSITSSSWEGSKFCAEQRSESLAKSDTHCIHRHFSSSCFYQGIWPQVLISKNFCPGDSFYTDRVIWWLWALCAVSEEALRSDALKYRNCETVPRELGSGLATMLLRVQHNFIDVVIFCHFGMQLKPKRWSFITISLAPRTKPPSLGHWEQEWPLVIFLDSCYLFSREAGGHCLIICWPMSFGRT